MKEAKFDNETLRLIDRGFTYNANSSWLLKLKFDYITKKEGREKGD